MKLRFADRGAFLKGRGGRTSTPNVLVEGVLVSLFVEVAY